MHAEVSFRLQQKKNLFSGRSSEPRETISSVKEVVHGSWSKKSIRARRVLYVFVNEDKVVSSRPRATPDINAYPTAMVARLALLE
jgi:hypothetical protein